MHQNEDLGRVLALMVQHWGFLNPNWKTQLQVLGPVGLSSWTEAGLILADPDRWCRTVFTYEIAEYEKPNSNAVITRVYALEVFTVRVVWAASYIVLCASIYVELSVNPSKIIEAVAKQISTSRLINSMHYVTAMCDTATKELDTLLPNLYDICMRGGDKLSQQEIDDFKSTCAYNGQFARFDIYDKNTNFDWANFAVTSKPTVSLLIAAYNSYLLLRGIGTSSRVSYTMMICSAFTSECSDDDPEQIQRALVVLNQTIGQATAALDLLDMVVGQI